MSLVLCGDGHLDVLVLYEQHFPRLIEGRVEFVICYDIIVRSYARTSLSHISVLSQYAASDEKGPSRPVFDLVELPERSCFDEVFLQCRRGSPAKPYYQLSFPFGMLERDASSFQVNRLWPVIETPRWMLEREDAKAAASVWATGFTLGEIHFADDQQILPYDADDPCKTTYWFRLCIRQEMNREDTPTTVFGPLNSPLLAIQYCTILGSQAILDRFDDDMVCLIQDSKGLAAGARQAKEFVFDGTFRKEGTSTAIRDHRICVATSRQFLVLNPRYDGPCGFVGVEPLRGEKDTVTRTWIAGADHYWQTDPLALARQVYLYLKEWAFSQAMAKAKEQISTAVLPEEHANICYVIEALEKLRCVREVNEGARYYVDSESVEQALSVLNQQPTASSRACRDAYVRARDILYGKLPQPAFKGGSSRFIPKGFRIQFELASAPG